MGDRHICTKDDPYDAALHTRAAHPDSVWISSESDDIDGSEWETRKCPHCGVRFTMEISR